MRDSAPPVVERPGLEDVVEEEDVFAVEGSPKSGWQVPGEKEVDGAKEEEEVGQLSVSQMEAEFVQLNLRKQVSYR
ncbi:diacylglycerol kinase zeta-like isoform X7 [Lates japonicus]